jgi:hypothetical protein
VHDREDDQGDQKQNRHQLRNAASDVSKEHVWKILGYR